MSDRGAAGLRPAHVDHSESTGARTGGVLALIALYGCVAIPLALYLNVWIDESYSLFATTKHFGALVAYSREFMLQPPLFFVLLWIWRQVSMEIWFARLLPVLIVGATLWIVHLASRKWYPKLSSVWVVLPLAINPWVVFGGTELRPYCLVLFWSALLLLLFYDAFMVTAPRMRAQALYLIAAALSIYTYYYIGFVLAGGGVALVAWRRWRAVRDYAAVMGIVGVLIIPQFLAALEHADSLTHSIATFPGFLRSIVYSVTRIFALEVNYFYFDERFRPLWIALTLGIPGAAALLRFRTWTFTNSAVPIIAIVIGVAYFLVTWKVAGEDSFFRHFLVALIPIHLSIVSVADHFGESRARVLRIFMSMLTVASVVGSAMYFAPMAKPGDYRRAAHYIQANERAGEPIFVVLSDAEYPLRYYYQGENEIVPLPEHDPLVEYDYASWALEGPAEVREKLAGVRPGERIWVYADRGPDASFHGVSMGLEFLEQVLNEDYELVSDQAFFEARVREFVRK